MNLRLIFFQPIRFHSDRHIANKNRNAIKLSKILVATAMMPLAGAILKTFITNAITGKRLIPYHIM